MMRAARRPSLFTREKRGPPPGLYETDGTHRLSDLPYKDNHLKRYLQLFPSSEKKKGAPAA